jgi:hypothetical protein
LFRLKAQGLVVLEEDISVDISKSSQGVVGDPCVDLLGNVVARLVSHCIKESLVPIFDEFILVSCLEPGAEAISSLSSDFTFIHIQSISRAHSLKRWLIVKLNVQEIRPRVALIIVHKDHLER